MKKASPDFISLAPLDHIPFSGIDKIICDSLADATLDEAKHLFGVKFWGLGKLRLAVFFLCFKSTDRIFSPIDIRYCQVGQISDSYI
jgi:hypothetical protein